MTDLAVSLDVVLNVEKAVAFPSCLSYWDDDKMLTAEEDIGDDAFHEVGAHDVDDKVGYLDEEVVHAGVANNKVLLECSVNVAAVHEDCKIREVDEVHSDVELAHHPGCSPIELAAAS
mmetsp:Transcript_773/g.1585  ORF Transcript_773/g.1585 Transcript_773/m.1585 type:complete len:118 (-) Transcript_773:795-1148(-)